MKFRYVDDQSDHVSPVTALQRLHILILGSYQMESSVGLPRLLRHGFQTVGSEILLGQLNVCVAFIVVINSTFRSNFVDSTSYLDKWVHHSSVGLVVVE